MSYKILAKGLSRFLKNKLNQKKNCILTTWNTIKMKKVIWDHILNYNPHTYNQMQLFWRFQLIQITCSKLDLLHLSLEFNQFLVKSLNNLSAFWEKSEDGRKGLTCADIFWIYSKAHKMGWILGNTRQIDEFWGVNTTHSALFPIQWISFKKSAHFSALHTYFCSENALIPQKFYILIYCML